MARILNGGFRPRVGSRVNTKTGPRIVQPAARPISDTDRLNWLAQKHVTLRAVEEVSAEGDGSMILMWQVQDARKSLSGHPLGDVRETIDAAMSRPNKELRNK
jgi:hypothetical protein